VKSEPQPSRRAQPALNLRRTLTLLAGVALSALTLYLALRNVDMAEVWSALMQARPLYVLLALASVALNTLAKTVRWRVLLGEPGRAVSLLKLLMALLSGQMLNTLYPARIGDLSRAYVIGGEHNGRERLGRTYTLGTVLLEKLLDMLAYVLLFLLLIVLIPLPAWVNDSLYTFALAIVVAAAGVGLAAYRPDWLLRIAKKFLTWFPRRWFPGRLRRFALARIQDGLASLKVLHSRSDLLRLAFWSALVWGTAILNNHLALLALDIHLPWTASLLVLMVLQAGISIPSVPGKIGIFEYSCVLALGVYGVAQAPALSYGILLHAIVLVPSTLLGLVFFWMLGLSASRQELLAAAPEPGPAGLDGGD
jgi:uncharacterized protein (TIRG00374 family)